MKKKAFRKKCNCLNAISPFLHQFIWKQLIIFIIFFCKKKNRNKMLMYVSNFEMKIIKNLQNFNAIWLALIYLKTMRNPFYHVDINFEPDIMLQILKFLHWQVIQKNMFCPLKVLILRKT